MVRRSREPFFWAMFSSGGMLAALLLPALVLLLWFALPLGWVDAPSHAELSSKIGRPLVKLALFVLIMLSLFHWAHRFRYTLYDGLQIKHLNEMINVFCYGGAIVGSVVAGYLLWQVP